MIRLKQAATSLLLPLLTTQLFGQAPALQHLEQDLIRSYEKILTERLETASPDWDRLETYNNAFREQLHGYTARYPATLLYPFDALKEDHIHIVTSEDNLFRIYSWDTWLGGTMHDFTNIFQYSTGDTVHARTTYDTIAPDGQYTPFYSAIFTLKANNKTYYLAVNNGVYSTKDASQSIKAFTIENGTLNDTIKLFNTPTGMLDQLDVNFDFFSVADRSERPLRLIRYNAKTQTIDLPVVQENGKITKKYIRYRFTGQYFEQTGTTKKRK